jgi:hypothetical protein
MQYLVLSMLYNAEVCVSVDTHHSAVEDRWPCSNTMAPTLCTVLLIRCIGCGGQI